MLGTIISPTQLRTSQYYLADNTSTFFYRWADIQFNGNLEAVDQGVEAMVDIAKVIMETAEHNSVENAIDDLECAAYATIRELRKILALFPTRAACLPFDGGLLLFNTVSQFFPYSSQIVQNAIFSGAKLAEQCSLGILKTSDLSEDEILYRSWVTPHIIQHLIPDAYDDEPE